MTALYVVLFVTALFWFSVVAIVWTVLTFAAVSTKLDQRRERHRPIDELELRRLQRRHPSTHRNAS